MDDISLISRISDLYKRMSHAAMKAGRSPEEVRLIAVSKTVGIERIKEAIDAGLRVFGENRVQEAREKISNFKFQISDIKTEWHLIGHLQKNKAKYAVQLFDLIHTIDSARLAEEVNKEAQKIGKIQRILVQIKLSDEVTKHGVTEDEFMPLLEIIIKNLKNLKLEGIMTMPPYFEDPRRSKLFFAKLRELRDRAEKRGFHLPELSMGMSNDFEIAIEEGATMVRVGSAIFGERR